MPRRFSRTSNHDGKPSSLSDLCGWAAPYAWLMDAPSDEIAEKLARFMGAFEVVFKGDWEYSRLMLERQMDYAVGSQGSFIEPSGDWERANWGSRTALLKAHRELLEAMADRGMAPQLPRRDAYFNYTWPSESGVGADEA